MLGTRARVPRLLLTSMMTYFLIRQSLLPAARRYEEPAFNVAESMAIGSTVGTIISQYEAQRDAKVPAVF